MNSISDKCNILKTTYDKCFNQWYSEKFLKGDTTDDCGELFKEYKACVTVSRMIVVNYIMCLIIL